MVPEGQRRRGDRELDDGAARRFDGHLDAGSAVDAVRHVQQPHVVDDADLDGRALRDLSAGRQAVGMNTPEVNRLAAVPEKFFNLPVAAYWSAAAAILFIIGSFAVLKSLNESAVPLQPIAAIELDYYRSAGGAGGVDENLDLLWHAMTMASLGEGNEAVKMLDDRAEQLEDGDLKLEFLITVGSIYYNMDQFDQAADRFESAQKIDTGDMAFMERNYWYLGNTYLRLNKLADARTILEKTVNMNGAYSRVAEAYLRDLEE